MLELNDLVVGYGGAPVLRGLTARLRAGVSHGIVGRNGEGKTTLLRLLSGLLAPESGSARWRVDSDDRMSGGAIAFLPSEPFFYPWITAREHLEVCTPVGSDFDPRAWCELLELPADLSAETFSSGMKRRLGLLACIALDRPVLALDEPFNNLDAESSHLVGEILRRLVARGRTLLVTSHVPGSLEQTCDEIHWLHGGVFAQQFSRANFPEIAARVFGALHEQRLEQFDEMLNYRSTSSRRP